MKKIMMLAFLVTIATGCASNKGITDISQVKEPEMTGVVILQDKSTRESVLPVLEKWFYDNGYHSTVVSSLSEVGPDDYILSYRAWWSWDLATYMRKVEMNVKSKGQTLGNINFDALQYGGFGKFGDAEQRLNILLDAMFGKITVEEANKRLGDA